jgi:aryl-alcohol dehydrogenase-like predicted oxidoreductase
VLSLIIGASRREQVSENVKALEFVDLIMDEMKKKADQIVPTGFLGRYANDAHGMPSVIY